MNQDNAGALMRSGVACLQAGKAREAHDYLRRAIAADPDSPGYYLLAQACRLLGDEAGERDALDRHLRREPRHLAALLLAAEHHARAKDDRAASSFYRTAFAVAGQPGAAISPTIEAMLQRGTSFVQEADRRFADHLAAITNSGEIEDGHAGRRLRHAVDLLMGRSQLYLQQPSTFYFPELPQRQFYEREEFSWLPEVEKATEAIKRELEAVLNDSDAFRPYVEYDADRPASASALLDDPSWGAFYLWRSGKLVPENAARCPATMRALEHPPMPEIGSRSPMALFSRLKPGTHIKPHNGLLNTRLICHLPIIVPPDCALRVGNETRAWRDGEMLIFDDSIEHEAWNRSSHDRVVLLFEIWRPEITDAERQNLTRIFEVIERYDERG